MFRLPGLGRRLFDTRPLTNLGSSKVSLFNFTSNVARTTRPSSTWSKYNRHYGLHRINWGSLKKPAIFTASFCLVTTMAAPYLMSIPPLNTLSRRPGLLVYSIIGLNVAGFFAWRMPAVSRYMYRYGLLVKDNIHSQWSLLGSAFSHKDPLHLMFNMLMLYSFGPSFASAIGAANFLSLYLSSAVFSSFASIAIPTIMRTSVNVASLGASGALFSVFGAFSYLVPKANVALFFFPVPGGAWVLFLGSVALNAAGVLLRWGRYDYAAHLGGSIAGIFYGWYYSRLRKSRAQRPTRIMYR